MAVLSGVRLNDLPKIGNGRLIATKEPMPFIGTTCTSLPPLTNYYVAGIPRRRWGEDETMKPLVSSGLSKYGCNFDACHPVLEGPEVKYEGYMFPKALRHDLGKFHASLMHTGRHVPRTATCEVFPRNNISRKSNIDGSHILGEATRRSIEDCFSLLYRTTHYDNTYRDTSRHMRDRLSRDAQYHVEGPNYVEAPTCTRVHNHPDPCHRCWTGGYNRDFNLKLAEFQSKLPSLTTDLHLNSKLETNASCKDCYNTANQENICACTVENSEKNMTVDAATEQCTSCGRSKDIAETTIVEAIDMENNAELSFETCSYNTKEQFGPWVGSIDQNKNETLLVGNAHQFQLPSSLHCRGTENDFTINALDRHGQLNHGNAFPKPWTSLYMQKINHTPPSQPNMALVDVDMVTTERERHEGSAIARNTWTFRDENNIRKPCIANVFHNFHKSDAHKRYHEQHQEVVPDLRDNTRYSKRVQFYGYNSSVYR